MFTISNAAPDATMITVSFTNVILSSHTVEPDVLDPADPNPLPAHAAGIYSASGGVSISLKAVTITAMDAGAGALALGAPGDGSARKGSLTVSSSTITGNTARNEGQAAGFTVKNSGAIRISATTLTANKAVTDGTVTSTLYISASDSVTIDSSTIKGNYAEVKADGFTASSLTALIALVPQISVSASTFAENMGGGLAVLGDDTSTAEVTTSALLIKATTFSKNTGGTAGALIIIDSSACISATTFSANVALGATFSNDVAPIPDTVNAAAGALFMDNAIVSGSSNTFKLNRVSTALSTPTEYWAQSILAYDSSAVFTATTVDASGSSIAPDVVSGFSSALAFCRSNFVRMPKTMIPLSLATTGAIADATDSVGTIDVCPSTPYQVVGGSTGVTTTCSTCSAVGNMNCASKAGYSWLPWLNNIYPGR